MKRAIEARLGGINFGVVLGIGLTMLLLMALWAAPASAYEAFQEGCAACHPIFVDGGASNATHNTHAGLAGNNCATCHVGAGWDIDNPPLSNCVVCHGREADAGGDSASAGLGRGLRQHHVTVGAAPCDDCHTDTDHAVIGSAPENVLPSFYPGPAGLDPCNGSEERFASSTVSLDNDGDGLTDGADPDCAAAPPKAPADFNGDGISDIGVYRDGVWYLDLNNNDQWDGCEVDGCYVFGMAGDQPVVGDWAGLGRATIGVYRDGGWYLDLNGNRQWDPAPGCSIVWFFDSCATFGLPGDQAVVGDWDGGGRERIGVFRDGGWYLDLDNGGQWDGCEVDGCYVFGMAGDQPVVGDWTGNGEAKIGVFRDGGWYLDLNGNRQWDGCEVDGCYVFGLAGDQAVVGDWTGSGQANIGVYRDGVWYLDLNNNDQWDGCEVDGCYVFGLSGGIPAN